MGKAMRAKHKFILSVSVAVVMLVTGTTAWASNIGRAVREAQALAHEGRFDESARLLFSVLERLDDTEEKGQAGGALYFTLGYVFQLYAANDPAGRTAHLEAAARYYNESSGRLVDIKKVQFNLSRVYRDMGKAAEFVRIMRELLEQEANVSYLVDLGDGYAALGRFNEALAAYRRAEQTEPANELPIRRIITLYQKLPKDSLAKLFSYSVELQRQNRGHLAAPGFELIFKRADQSMRRLALESLVHWAELRLTEGPFGPLRLKFLRSTEWWDSTPVMELRHMITTPESIDGSRLLWWGRGLYKRHVAASILYALATQDSLGAMRDPRDSQRILSQAMAIAPAFHRYDENKLRERPVVSMDIALELAGSLHQFGKFEGTDYDFDSLVAELFNEKSLAYARRDSAAIQRYHTVLGIIYTEKGIWKSTGRRAANARFQLEHAVETASSLMKRDPAAYQPIPHLYDRLITVYENLNEKKLMYSASLNAAQGYLDLDDLGKAGEMLDLADKYDRNAKPGDKDRQQMLKTIMNSRHAVSRIPARASPASRDIMRPRDRFHIGPGDVVLRFDDSIQDLAYDLVATSSISTSREQFTWLNDPPPAYIDSSFVKRQQFKCLSDLASRAEAQNRPQGAVFLRTAALERISGQQALACTNDIARLKTTGDALQERVTLDTKRPMIATGDAVAREGMNTTGKVWTINNSSARGAIEVGVSEDALLASRVFQLLGPDNAQARFMLMPDKRIRFHTFQFDSLHYQLMVNSLDRDGILVEREGPD
jgi:tetratricopeptide (TPR) repeat protein